MKKVLMFCFLFTHFTMHCMEQSQSTETSCEDAYETSDNSINYVVEEPLADDCWLQVNTKLEEYKKSNNFTPQDMDNILGVISFIINDNDRSVGYIHGAKDDDKNGFFQHALNKTDVSIIKWLIEKGNTYHHRSKECEDFVVFCREQLLPTVEENKRKEAYAIFKAVMDHYKIDTVFKNCRASYIDAMINLQLEHRASQSQFTIDEELLTPFLAQDEDNVAIALSDIYQKRADKVGNTLAHIVVEQHDADELYTLMKKNYISKTVKNNNQKTVYALAFDKHRVFTKDTTLVDLQKDKARLTRCCYFMLDKYFADAKEFGKKKDCCKNHTITKNYNADELCKLTGKDSSSKMNIDLIEKIDDPEKSKFRCGFKLLNCFKVTEDDYEPVQYMLM